MSEDTREIQAVLEAFLAGNLTPGEFVDRFAALWRELVDEQDQAIAQCPPVDYALKQLRAQYNDGQITTDEYLHAVQVQYAQLPDTRLHPGSTADLSLSQLSVTTDAYGEDEDAAIDEPHVSADELRAEVRRTLEVLRTS